MVRTRDGSGLSEPISLESVRQPALSLDRPDLNSHDSIEVILVTLATAVRFVADLQRREELAFSESAPNSAVEPDICPLDCRPKMISVNITDVDEWCEKLMEIADYEEVENVREVQKAVLIVKAMHQGQSRPLDFWPSFDNGTWR